MKGPGRSSAPGPVTGVTPSMVAKTWCEHAAGRLAQSVMPGFDAPPAAVEGGPELAMGAGGVPPELFPLMRAGIDLNTGVRS